MRIPRTWIVAPFAVAVAVLGAPSATAQTEPDASQQRPNILVIVTDDQRKTNLATHMPNTHSWFVRGGMDFDRAYAATPVCCPSRASIMTGQYAHNHGVRFNGTLEPLGGQDATMQARLQDAGYYTGIYGKFLNSWDVERNPPYWDRFGLMEPRRAYYDTLWNLDGEMQTVSTYSTRFIEDRALDFIRDRDGSRTEDDRPWMLYLAPYAPHSPFTAEPEYERAEIAPWRGNPAVLEADVADKPRWIQRQDCDIRCGRSLRRNQARTLFSVDDMVAGIGAALEHHGETNTLAIYISDNGFTWGEHGTCCKDTPYTRSIQVPLLARWPGHIAPGTTSSDMVLNVDVAPTVLEAAQIDQSTMDGRSLLTGATRRRAVFEHWCNTHRRCHFWASTRTADYQYVEHYDDAGAIVFREYYDLTNDPWQLENVLADGIEGNEPDLAPLHDQLAADRTCTAATCP